MRIQDTFFSWKGQLEEANKKNQMPTVG